MPILDAPDSGVTVRMYRQGHGDCFLLAFRKSDGDPLYMLVDCGYKPGSKVHASIQEIVDDIHQSTGGRLDLVLITHEHQDHVNGFWEKVFGNEIARFDDFEIGQLWLAWTEDPDDDFANDLRQRFGDELLGLVAASRRLAAAGGDAEQALAARIDQWLELESGDFGASPFAIEGWSNKRAIQYVKEMCPGSPTYLLPFERVYTLPGVDGVTVYALGPPRNEQLLLSLDPIGGEGYVHHLAAIAQADAFYAAAMDQLPDFAAHAGESVEAQQPFGRRWRIPEEERARSPHAEFFATHLEGEANAWRRIDCDWLRTAETLALRLNGEVNNTSAVIAIELPQSGRVLLFVGDAQRGNWVSWDDGAWADADGAELTAEELLGRTVLYKVGHHGSHNATLKGLASSGYPSLGWLARGDYAPEFVAMIPANQKWANEKAHWTHPLPSIRDALMRKAKGRVFQTDVDRVKKRATIGEAEWEEFQGGIVETDLYFQYTVADE
ncbi:MAG TPA: hypothetical protein VMS86_01280 [Thermoanaerobaculia bacterium]|nr:hypothetical protein [Thermoanaerobaculia bacterium]